VAVISETLSQNPDAMISSVCFMMQLSFCVFLTLLHLVRCTIENIQTGTSQWTI